MSEIETGTYQIIDGVYFSLPAEARYTCVESNGVLYYCTRKPRVVFDDEHPDIPIGFTVKKTPVHKVNADGFLRAVILPKEAEDWLNSPKPTICKKDLPDDKYLMAASR